MLKAREGAELMADLMGTTHLANHYLTRLIRLQGRDEWPAIGSGRKDTGLTTRHLLNNLVGFSCSVGQPGEAPRRVQEFNLLRRDEASIRHPAGVLPKEANALWYPGTFIEQSIGMDDEAVQNLVTVALEMVLQAVRERLGYPTEYKNGWPSLCLKLGSYGSPLSAEVITYYPDFMSVVASYYVDEDLLPGLQIPIHRMPFRTQVVLGRDEFMQLATIAVKTGEYDDIIISASPVGEVAGNENTPESKTAATDPLPGKSAAALSDQPTIGELDGSVQPHPTDERESSQSSFRSRAGRGRQQDRHQTNHQQRRMAPSDRSFQYDCFEHEPCGAAA